MNKKQGQAETKYRLLVFLLLNLLEEGMLLKPLRAISSKRAS